MVCCVLLHSCAKCAGFNSDSQITIWHYATDFWYAKVARAIATKLWGWFNRVNIGPEPQRYAPQKKFARAAGRYMPIRARDGTRESDTHTYLTNASLGP